jgi:hypothetical protein
MHNDSPLSGGRLGNERCWLLRDGEGHRSETECQQNLVPH